MVILLRLLIASGIINLSIGMLRSLFFKGKFIGSFQDLYTKYSCLPFSKVLEIECHGIASEDELRKTGFLSDFLSGFSKEFS